MSRQSRATTPTRSASSFRASLARRLLYLLFGAISAGTVFGATPVITDVSIPNVPMNVGDNVTATITVNNDPDAFTLISGSVAGFALGGLVKNSNTEYEATFTITDGGTDYAAGDDIPVANLVLEDASSNQNAPYSQNIVQGGDPIDANNPAAFTAGAVVTTGGTVVANYWNGTNTGVDVTIPIANDTSLDGGTMAASTTL